MRHRLGIVALAALLGVQALAQVHYVRDYGSFEYYQDKNSAPASNGSFITTGPDDHFLAWKCVDGKINVNMYDDTFKLKEDASVTYRVDTHKAVGPQQWVASNTGKSAFVPDGQVKAFTQAALAGRSVNLQLTDAAGKRSSYTYKLDGLSTALALLPCKQYQ